MADSIKLSLERIRQSLRRHLPSVRKRGRVIKALADQIGLVYFGAVDQHQDDHQIIGGVTVSATHRDNHYSIGTFDDYDIHLVNRSDITVNHTDTVIVDDWLIIEIPLQVQVDRPYLFLVPHHDSRDKYIRLLSLTSHQVLPIDPGYTSEFINRYLLYGTPTNHQSIHDLLTPTVAAALAAHFWPYAFELTNGRLIGYVAHVDVTTASLSDFIKKSVWLAKTLDE